MSPGILSRLNAIVDFSNFRTLKGGKKLRSAGVYMRGLRLSKQGVRLGGGGRKAPSSKIYPLKINCDPIAL